MLPKNNVWKALEYAILNLQKCLQFDGLYANNFQFFFCKNCNPFSHGTKLKIVKIWQLKKSQNKDSGSVSEDLQTISIKSPVLELKGGL